MIEMKDDGGSAFPSTTDPAYFGMTLRDYFAATAMQGVIAGSGDSDGCVNYSDDKVAKLAYDMADAMLKARLE